MSEILIVEDLKKTFKLSKKQQKIEKTNEKIKKAVDGLSFVAYKGEIFGLLGPNGAGKTTTLRVISTLIKKDSGKVILDGLDLDESEFEIRNKIGFLTSELKLEEYFTPNYLFDFFGHLHNMSNEDIEKRKNELFDKFGIHDFKEVKIADLSTGMKQKISLCISIVHNPSIIIFDEPTNGLDIITAKTVTEFLKDLRNEGKTIILSTHIFSLVEELCDRVGIIIDGKMRLLDTLKNITKDMSLSDKFFEVYGGIYE